MCYCRNTNILCAVSLVALTLFSSSAYADSSESMSVISRDVSTFTPNSSSANTLPAKATHAAETGAFSGTPVDGDYDSFAPILSATDGGLSTAQTAMTTVSDVFVSDILPPPALGDWSNAGVQGGIPDYPVGVDVMDYGAVGDGAADDTAAILAAMNDCSAGNAVVFPAGTYVVTSDLTISTSIVLRGAAPTTTHIVLKNEYTNINITSDWAGIEDIHVHTAWPNYSSYGGTKIVFTGVENSWCRNIETSGYVGYHIHMPATSHCEIRDSYIHNSLEETETVDPFRSYGVHIQNSGSAYNLVENNIFDWFRHAMVVQEFDGPDPHHNVFAYNFSWNVWTSDGGFSATTDMEFHNHGTALNLVEGSVIEQVGFQSPEHHSNTVFRNRINNGGVRVDNENYVIGNEFTAIKNPESPQARWGNCPFGIEGDSIDHGNYVTDPFRGLTWDPDISDHTIPNSYYLDSRPQWFGDLTWPCYGGDLMPGNTRRNPAEVRYWSMMYPEVSPSDLVAEVEGNDVTLSWTNNSNSDRTVDFILSRSSDNINFERIAETSDTTYTDTVSENGQYYYYVRARNYLGGASGTELGGESHPSNVFDVAVGRSCFWNLFTPVITGKRRD